MGEFVTFKKYSSIEDTEYVAYVLKENGIAFELENTSPNFDITMSNNHTQDEFRIKVEQENFEKASELLIKISEENEAAFKKDYFLFSFSNEELLEVLRKREEWDEDNYVLARKVLKERGLMIDDDELYKMQENRLEELRKPEVGDSKFVARAISGLVLGGVVGILFCLYHFTFKKTLPNGERVYVYDLATRKLAKKLFVGSIISTLIWGVVIIYNDFFFNL